MAGPLVTALAVVGAVVVVAIVAFVVWNKCFKRTQRIERRPYDSVDIPVGGEDEEQGLLSFTRHSKLDPQTMQLPQFRDLKPPMYSLHDYARTLYISEGFKWADALRTVLTQPDTPLMLPANETLAGRRRDAEEEVKDPVGGSQLLYMVLNDLLSPLHLAGLAQMGHTLMAKNAEPLPPENSALGGLMVGARNRTHSKPGVLPNPFVLDTHLPELLQGMDPNAPPELAEGKQAFDWLPDIALAGVGRGRQLNAYGTQLGEILSALLNRLAANCMPEEWKPEGMGNASTTVVKVTEGGSPITTAEGLIRALVDECDADVTISVVSRATPFGLALSVKNGEEWANIPFVLPIRTGIALLEGTAKSSGESEIKAVVTHSELAVRSTKSKYGPFRMGFNIGLAKFAGWFPGSNPVEPWLNGDGQEIVHSGSWSEDECWEALKMTSVVAAIVNAASDAMRMTLGGYGFLGVCNDSVAMIQSAMGKPVTAFPCLAAGGIRTAFSQALKAFMEKSTDEALVQTAKKIQSGLFHMPCDVMHEPEGMLDAIDRIAGQIPTVTPLAILEAAREDLKEARRQYEAEGIHNYKTKYKGRF